MPAIIKDLGDWVAETRVKTSQLLYELLLHAEDYTTQHMQPLVQALLKACSDDQPVVVECVRMYGFVHPVRVVENVRIIDKFNQALLALKT